MQVQFIRMAAPFKRGKKGVRPSARVLVATDMVGRDWVHNHEFASHEVNKGIAIMRRIDNSGEINEKYWRLAR